MVEMKRLLFGLPKMRASSTAHAIFFFKLHLVTWYIIIMSDALTMSLLYTKNVSSIVERCIVHGFMM